MNLSYVINLFELNNKESRLRKKLSKTSKHLETLNIQQIILSINHQRGVNGDVHATLYRLKVNFTLKSVPLRVTAALKQENDSLIMENLSLDQIPIYLWPVAGPINLVLNGYLRFKQMDLLTIASDLLQNYILINITEREEPARLPEN